MFLCFSYPWTHTRLSMQLTQHWPRNKWFLHVSSLKTGQWFQSFIWFRLKIGLLSNPVFVIIFSICVLSTYRIPLLWHVLPTLYIYIYLYIHSIYGTPFSDTPRSFFCSGVHTSWDRKTPKPQNRELQVIWRRANRSPAGCGQDIHDWGRDQSCSFLLFGWNITSRGGHFCVDYQRLTIKIKYICFRVILSLVEFTSRSYFGGDGKWILLKNAKEGSNPTE